ncbi:unnamed protein product, partial [Polarella glacialis]
GQSGGSGGGSMAAVSQLFARLSQEIEEQKPKNCIHFMVDFLCKHYPEHLHGFASIWQMDPDLERERHEVVNFFKAHKISTAVAAHFTNAGFDTLDTLTTLSPDSLVDVEAFNNVKWLPGHKVRLQQIFGEISARVRACSTGAALTSFEVDRYLRITQHGEVVAGFFKYSSQGPTISMQCAVSGSFHKHDALSTVQPMTEVLPVLGACACLVAVAAWLGKDAPKLRSSKVTGEVVSKSVAMEPLDNPSRFPDFTVKRVLHNNLGGQGPDSGEPTIIYHIEASNMGDDLDMIMEALNPQDFKPWDAKKAGMWDKYQSVNIKGGSELHARFSFRSHRTHEPVTLPHFDMEFFDMDEQSSHVGREKITFHGQWREYMLEKDALMSTSVSGAHDEDLSFEATSIGTGSDNPPDPDKLILREARKAFGITYRHAHSFDVTMSASAAPWPRFFLFIPKPSLLTLKSKDELDEYGEAAPAWVDLTASRDIMGVVPPHDLITFDHWTVKVGDVVKKGDSILLARSANGQLSELTAPTDGTIIALEPLLETGMSIKKEANVALIKAPVWIDLIASPEDEAAVVPPGELKFFDHWIVKVGDVVKNGDTILWAKSADGKASEVKAPLDGTVKALENMLEKGWLLKEGAAVGIISLPAWVDIIAGKGKDTVFVVPPGELKAFDHWTVKVGDKVNKGDTILLAKSEHGKLSELKSPKTGTVTVLESILQNGRLFKTGAAVAVIQVPPLWVDLIATKDDRYVVAPAELTTFDHWTVKVGDVVKKGDSILLARSANGQLSEVTAPTDGTIIALEPLLETGMSIKKEANVALIKAPVWIDLIASPEDEAAVVPPGELKFFDHWIVKVGDVVKNGDTILWAKSADGKASEVKAPLDGTVKALENMLEKGWLLKEGAAVGIISLPAWVDIIAGTDTVFVAAPAELTTFDHWTVKVGEDVKKGESILWAKSDKGFFSVVNATATGSVIALEPFLEKGRPIKPGAAVAVIQVPVP